jgi:hypothetical protein
MPTTHWVVDVEVGVDQAQDCADRVKHWLIQEGVVLPTPPEPTEVFPASSPCYPKHLLAPGPKALDWCSTENDFSVFSGLEIVRGKRVFDPGGSCFRDAIECPNCNTRFDSSTLEWTAAIDGWWARNDGALTCPACKTTKDIGQWIFPDSSWAFGYLGFGFNEWYVDERIMEAISTILQHRCVFVWSHI